MTRKMSSILETRFRLLEDEKFIREMETEMDYFKEQMFLMSEAIKRIANSNSVSDLFN